MRVMLATIVALFTVVLSWGALAGPTENITGCATAPATNSNFTVRVDVSCPLSDRQGSSDAIIEFIREKLEK